MGLCLAKQNRSYERINCNENTYPEKRPNDDYRVDLIEAFVVEIQKQLYHEYLLTDFDIFCIIPSSINELILCYLSRYQVYGIRSGTVFSINRNAVIPLFNQLESLQNILPNPSLLSRGNNKLLLKTLNNTIYSIPCNKYDDLSSSSTNNITQNTNLKTLNPFDSGDDKQKQLEFISNTFDGIDDYVIFYKLKDGSIYTSNIVATTHKLSPMIYDNTIENIIQIECGQQHTLFLSDKGRVYSMGKNHRGQCGVSTKYKYYTEAILIDTFIKNKCKIISISCGKNHNCCIDGINNNLYCFGDNKYNQCNEIESSYIWHPIIYDERDNDIIKAKCGRNSTIILYSNGNILVFGELDIIMNKLKKDMRFKDFDIGLDHIVLISLDDKMYSFGQYDQRNIYKLKQKMFPNLATNSLVHTVIAMPNNTIVIFN